MRARKSSQPQRFQIAFRRDVVTRLKKAAARRDLTVRQYVADAIEQRVHADLADADSPAMTSNTDPVLGTLWNNRRDAAYDRL